jgi:hypothetical protein
MTHLQLHIGAQHTSLVAQHTSLVAQQQTSMPVGWQSALPGNSQRLLPSAAALEMAIMQVEDAISANWPQRLALDTVHGSDPVLFRLASLSGLPALAGSRLERQQVEDLFSRLANAVEGGLATGLPATAEDISSLLILRELLHHLDIHSITLASPTV